MFYFTYLFHFQYYFTDSCQTYFIQFLPKWKHYKKVQRQCLLTEEQSSQYHKAVNKIIKKQAYNRKYLDVRAAHKRLYNKGVHIVVSQFKIVVAP